jgi:hypothetical protein
LARDRASTARAMVIATIHVFIDYQFVTRYYEEVRAVLTRS